MDYTVEIAAGADQVSTAMPAALLACMGTTC